MRLRTILSVVIALSSGYALASDMPWAKDYDSAKRMAKSGSKLIMLDFYADWCSYCKKLDQITFTDDDVVKLAKQVVPIRLNSEKGGSVLAEAHSVKALPTIVFVDADGEVWGEIIGYMPPKPYMKRMSGIIDVYKTYSDAMKTLARKPNDGKANAQIARVQAARGKLNEATAAINKMEAAKYKAKDAAKTFNAVGDGYKSANKFDEAIKYFIKANEAGKADDNVKERSYALSSIISYYRNNGDVKNAKKYRKELGGLKDGTKEYVDMAKRVVVG